MAITKTSEGPVRLEDHYRIIKAVESQVKERLRQIEHDWLLMGLRVGYRLPDDEDQEPGNEFKLEFGYLDELDELPERDVTVEEWERIVGESRHKNPLPIEFVEALYWQVKSELEKSAGQELLVCVCGTVTGSTTRCWGTGCYCYRPRRRWRYCYYNSYTRSCQCYCTDQAC